MNKTFHIYFLSLLFIHILSCQTNQLITINGKITYALDEISLGQQTIQIDQNGEFVFREELAHSTILDLEIQGEAYEIFVQPGKTIDLTITDTSLSFSGDLAGENDHLLSDKAINDEVNEYLSKNWYTIHRQDEDQFVQLIDSLKHIYLANLENAQSEVSKDFIEVNQASITYAFDRIILRYPEWHQRFTGNKVALNQDRLANTQQQLLNAKFYTLTSYQKYFKSWLDLELKETLPSQQDTAIYNGQTQLKATLHFLSEHIKDPQVLDFWTFEYIKGHIDQYTWINGKELLDDFKANCQIPAVLNQAEVFEQQILEERKGHDIEIYKSVKGYQLEAHIFKPDNFDTTKTYPVLAAFHGGGWQAGHAAWTYESAQQAANNGMVGIAIEYRLSNRADITPVEGIKDTRDAIRWIRMKADSLHIDPDKVVAKGISAGGHLTLSVSVLQDPALAITPEARPNALVLVSPAIDTQDEYVKSLLREDTDPSSISPLESLQANIQMPNTLILQGRTDRVTPTTFATAFKAKMDSLGYDCRLKIYEDCGHVFTPSHLDDTGTPQADPAIAKLAYEEQIQFLKELEYIE